MNYFTIEELAKTNSYPFYITDDQLGIQKVVGRKSKTRIGKLKFELIDCTHREKYTLFGTALKHYRLVTKISARFYGKKL